MRANKIRALLAGEAPLLSVGVYDCFSARIAESAGIPVLSISGNTLGASLLGLPDLGLITMTEVVNQARNIAFSVNVPVLADADTGYGNALNAMRAVREFEAAGVAGISLEDQVFPKKSSTIGKPGLVPVHEMTSKIRAACEARTSGDFLIIGRTDALSVEGLAAAIDRANRYHEAGADMIFINALKSEVEMRQAVKDVACPLKINIVEGHPASAYRTDQLFGFGFKLVSYSGVLQRAAGKAMLGSMDLLQREKSTEGSLKGLLMTPQERYAVLPVAEYRELDEKFLAPNAGPGAG